MLLTQYKGGPRDVDEWLLAPIFRILRLLECMIEDGEDRKEQGQKGPSSGDEAMRQMLEKKMLEARGAKYGSNTTGSRSP